MLQKVRQRHGKYDARIKPQAMKVNVIFIRSAADVQNPQL